MKEKKPRNIFMEGPIPPEKVANSIAAHQSKTEIGAHDIFLGQVRADVIKGKAVTAIDFTAYEEMAIEAVHQVKEEAFAKFGITCAHIYHSLGQVKTGELCLFVFTSAPHRQAAFASCQYIVEGLKARAPIFGKEILADDTHQWKVNT